MLICATGTYLRTEYQFIVSIGKESQLDSVSQYLNAILRTPISEFAPYSFLQREEYT